MEPVQNPKCLSHAHIDYIAGVYQLFLLPAVRGTEHPVLYLQGV